MDSKIIATIISSGVVLLGLLINMIKNKKEFRKTQKNLVHNLDYERVKERRDKLQNELDNFYIPLNSYLQRSKSIYITFKKNKHEDFRTLDYLLDRSITYDGEPVDWNKNDDVILKRILEVGKEIEKLIISEGALIQAEELKGVYKPSSGFDKAEYPEGLSLLDLTLEHLGYIRDAYEGNIANDIRFKKFVYPRELNSIVENKIEEVRSLISKETKSMNSFRSKML